MKILALVFLFLMTITGMVEAQEKLPRFESAACPFEGAEDRDDIQCGYLVVAQNRNRPEGRTLRLAVSILKSLSDEPLADPLVFLSGGPGGSSVKYSMFRMESPFWTPIRQKRDLIFFDQRGTGYSQPEFCDELDLTIQTSAFRGMSAVEEQAMVVKAIENCRDKMLNDGIDFGYYNTPTSALDLDDLRQVLGYSSWNLFGVSYGTRLALGAMRDTPKGIRSVVVDSVWPTNAPPADGNERLMRSLDLVFEQCDKNADCKAAFPTLRQDFFSMLDDYEEHPVPLEPGDPDRFPDGKIVINGNVLAGGVFVGLYDRDFIPVLPLVVREVGERNLDVLHALADGLVKEPSLSSGLQFAVNCYEWIPRITPELILADQSRHPELKVWKNLANYQAICNALHQQRADEAWYQPVYSDIPTLVAAGEFDPITPPSYAKLTTHALSNSTYIEIPAVGHAAIPYSDCGQEIMAEFLNDPTQSPDTACVAQISPANFITDVHVNPGVYRLAKLLQGDWLNARLLSLCLIMLLMITGIIIWPITWAVSRVRRSQDLMPAAATRARWLSAATSLLGLGFIAGLGFVVLQTAQNSPLLLGFGVPGNAGPLFYLPWLVALATIAVTVLTIIGWKSRWWSVSSHVHYSLITLACIGFVAWVFGMGLI